MALSDEDVGLAEPAAAGMSDADVGLAPDKAPAGPGFIASVKDHVAPVLNAFGQGFSEAWGPERLGISDKDQKWLSQVGLYAPEGAKSYNNPFHAFNELMIETVARGAQITTRGFMGAYRGTQAALIEAGAPKDVASIPDAFMGSPHPTGRPGAVIAERARANSLAELAAGERPANLTDLMHARELGVVGPQAPRISEGAPAEAAASAIQPTVAYHGSPHDFAAFSTEHIGTGEGAQSYGHGLYFAEHPGVARDYQFALGEPTVNGRPYDMNNALHKAASLVDETGSREAAIKDTKARAAHDPGDFYGDVLRHLESDKDLPKIETQGNMYQVRINADREHFLDWDKPLSEQSEHVQNAIRGLEDKIKVGWLPTLRNDLQDIRRDQIKGAKSGEELYSALKRGLTKNEKGVDLGQGQDAASRVLHDAGIPGIKYLDQGSRNIQLSKAYTDHLEGELKSGDPVRMKAAQEELDAANKPNQTRNFVVFNDKDVQITHKNGEPVEPVMSSPPTAPAVPQRAMAADRTPDDVLKGPKPGEEPTGNPWQDRFDKFVGKLNTPEDVQNLIRDAAKENDNFPAARNGDIPLAHVESIAEAAGIAPDTINRSGLGRVLKNDNQTRIAMRIMLQTTEDVKAAARDVKADGSPESMIKLQEAMMRRDLAVEQIVGLRAEWGRTGNVFQEFMRDVKDQETLNTFLKDKGRSPEDLKDIAKAIDELDRTQAARVLSDMHNKAPSPFYWTWINGLISGMLTHSKYIAANALYTATEHGVVTPLAAIIGRAKQVFGADVEKVYFGETGAAAYGMIAAVPTSLMATAKSIYSGQRAVLKSEIELHKAAVAAGEKVSPIIDRAVNQISGQGRPTDKLFGVVPLDGVWGRVIGAPGDVAMGIHTFFKILGERAALEAEAYHGAAKEGLSPADGDFWRRRSELAENPTTDMRERALASAYKGTFMNELGPKGKDWQRFTKGNPVLKWVFPFSHIPLNLLKATYEGTPFAFLDTEMRASLTGKNGSVVQDKAIARMVAGSAIMGYFTHQALLGRVTGDYPTDPKERDSWKLQGKQPNSILIGGYWVSFGKFGPAGDLANLGANIGSVIPHIHDGWTGKDDEGMTKATWQAANAAARLVVDEAGMLSLSMMFEAMHDEKKGRAWAANTAGSLLPFSSFIGQTASGGLPFTGGTFGDPYMREAKTFIDGLKYRLPGQRETLQPKRDWLGEPIPNPQYGNIIRQRLANTDPLSLEMDRLQIHPGLPQDRIGGVKLSPKVYDEYQVTAGAMTKQALDSLVNSPGWSDLPTSTRIDMMHAYISSSRKTAEAITQARHPELIGQGTQQRIDYITGKSLTKTPKKAPEAVAP